MFQSNQSSAKRLSDVGQKWDFQSSKDQLEVIKAAVLSNDQRLRSDFSKSRKSHIRNKVTHFDLGSEPQTYGKSILSQSPYQQALQQRLSLN
jgi:hypothetical protein